MRLKSFYIDLFRSVLAITLLGSPGLAAASTSCTAVFTIENKKTLDWTYYFAENLPLQSYGQVGHGLEDPQFHLKGGLTPGAPRVSYRKSTFSADPDKARSY